MTFKRPLQRRMAEAARQRAKYRHDPEHRLQRVNACRARDGKPPYASVEEVGSDFLSFHAARRHDERGRFA